MRHAVGRSVGRAKLKMKGDERRLAVRNQKMQYTQCLAALVPPASPDNSVVRRHHPGKCWNILVFYVFFSLSTRVVEVNSVLHAFSTDVTLSSMFSHRVSGVANRLEISFECFTLYLPHLVGCLVEVPQLRSSGDLMHSCRHTGSKSSKQIGFILTAILLPLCPLCGSVIVNIQLHQPLCIK